MGEVAGDIRRARALAEPDGAMIVKPARRLVIAGEKPSSEARCEAVAPRSLAPTGRSSVSSFSAMMIGWLVR